MQDATRTSRARQALLALVLPMVLATQWLSLAHAVLHATLEDHGRAAVDHHEGDSGHVAHASSHASWITAVVAGAAHHGGPSPLCELLDHLCHAAPIPAATSAGVQHPAFAPPRPGHTGCRSGVALANYSARAPPAVT